MAVEGPQSWTPPRTPAGLRAGGCPGPGPCTRASLAPRPPPPTPRASLYAPMLVDVGREAGQAPLLGASPDVPQEGGSRLTLTEQHADRCPRGSATASRRVASSVRVASWDRAPLHVLCVDEPGTPAHRRGGAARVRPADPAPQGRGQAPAVSRLPPGSAAASRALGFRETRPPRLCRRRLGPQPAFRALRCVRRALWPFASQLLSFVRRFKEPSLVLCSPRHLTCDSTLLEFNQENI